MKRAVLILTLGAALGLASYCGLYYSKTATTRTLQSTDQPELAWLKEEFCLSDVEYGRIRQLHEGYLPQCAAMCSQIAAANTELQALVLATNVVTPAMSAKLAEMGNLRQQCQTMMLNHFYAVSQTMPVEQGHRYLQRMQALTSLSNMRDHSLADHRTTSAMDHAHHDMSHSAHAH